MAAYEDGEMCRGKVFVNGEEKGVTPVKLEVRVGEHEVKVVCEEGEKVERVVVAHNGKLRLDWKIGRGPETGIEWVTISGGSFMMGSNDGVLDEKPVHRVRVPSFQMAKTEVTVAQYRACVEVGICSTPVIGWPCNWGENDRDDHPVNCVDWGQAGVFAIWVGGRLPSEAEWEFAARSGGKAIKYPWGNEKAICRRAVMDDGGNGCGKGNTTWSVCSKQAGNSAQGLCDLSGNVWEWTEDCWHGSYSSAPVDGSAWTTSCSGSSRVNRGGSWNCDARDCRAAYRGGNSPGYRNRHIGFRPARSIP
jgi:formylglycine-generating enzyme required for sulfatase activity